MTADITRLPSDKENRFSSVVFRQGQVFDSHDFLDAAYIDAYFSETERIDVIGREGAPADNAGFLIYSEGDAPAQLSDLLVTPGRYYVRGKLAELFDDGERLPLDRFLASDPPATFENGQYLAILEVYSRFIAAVEMPDLLLDPALRGVDTTGRMRVEWRIRLRKREGTGDCAGTDREIMGRTLPRLAPLVPKIDHSTNPCDQPNLGGFQGSENQLYRVEIYTGGSVPANPHDRESVNPVARNETPAALAAQPAQPPSFTWARDNASLLAEILEVWPDSRRLVISSTGRDPKMGFQSAKVIEILTADDLQHCRRGTLMDVATVEGESEIYVSSVTEVGLQALEEARTAGLRHYARRWDGLQTIDGAGNAIESRLSVLWEGGNEYRPGDYWCIPARALTGKLLWPMVGEVPAFKEPFGTRIDTAVLGVLETLDGNGWKVKHDCREIFYPLTRQMKLLYVGGAGQEAMPGAPLPHPLEVGVVNGTSPVEGANVEWALSVGVELDEPREPNMIVPTDARGISDIRVKLAADLPAGAGPIYATAQLLDENGNHVHTPVHFNLSQSVAHNVSYNAGTCGNLVGQMTVQSAIDRLASLARLTAVDGDHQMIRAGGNPRQAQILARPLSVRLWNLCGPIVGEKVTFIAKSGEVTPSDAVESGADVRIEVTTGPGGLASCFWQPGSTAVEADLTVTAHYPSLPPSVVIGDIGDTLPHATLTGLDRNILDDTEIVRDPTPIRRARRGASPRTAPETALTSDPLVAVTASREAQTPLVWQPQQVVFRCHLPRASEVDYTSNCGLLQGTHTVEDALNVLCKALAADDIPPHFQLIDVHAGKRRVRVASKVSLSSFLKGLTFHFSDSVKPVLETFDNATVLVQLEPSGDILGGTSPHVRVPIILPGKAVQSENGVLWALDGGLERFLRDKLFSDKQEPILARVTLYSDYIRAMRGEEDAGFLSAGASSLEGRQKVVDAAARPGGAFHFWFFVAPDLPAGLKLGDLKPKEPQIVGKTVKVPFTLNLVGPAVPAIDLTFNLIEGSNAVATQGKEYAVKDKTVTGEIDFVWSEDKPDPASLQLTVTLDLDDRPVERL